MLRAIHNNPGAPVSRSLSGVAFINLIFLKPKFQSIRLGLRTSSSAAEPARNELGLEKHISLSEGPQSRITEAPDSFNPD